MISGLHLFLKRLHLNLKLNLSSIKQIRTMWPVRNLLPLATFVGHALAAGSEAG